MKDAIKDKTINEGSYNILYGKYVIKKNKLKSIKEDDNSKLAYKGKYNRLFPNKVSSTTFMTLCALYSINSRPKSYGLQILDDIININRPTDAPIWKPAHSMMYGVLDKLKVQGLIVEVPGDEDDISYVPKNNVERKKRYYSITEKGKATLKELTEQYQEVLFSTSYFFNRFISTLYPEEAYKNMVISMIKQL